MLVTKGGLDVGRFTCIIDFSRTASPELPDKIEHIKMGLPMRCIIRR